MRAIERDNRPAVTYMVARLRVSRKAYDDQMLRRQRVIDENEEGLKKDPAFLQLPVPALAHKCVDIDMATMQRQLAEAEARAAAISDRLAAMGPAGYAAAPPQPAYYQPTATDVSTV